MAEERRQVEGRPAIVGPLPHDPGILGELSPDVCDEPEGAGLEEARARPVLEQETHDVILAGVRRDQERGIAALVAGVRQIRTGRHQLSDGLRLTATNGAEQVGDSAHEVRARGRARGLPTMPARRPAWAAAPRPTARGSGLSRPFPRTAAPGSTRSGAARSTPRGRFRRDPRNRCRGRPCGRRR